MTTVATVPAATPNVNRRAAIAAPPIDVVLLGLGRVGSAVAALALDAPSRSTPHIRIAAALVRDAVKPRDHMLHERLRLTADAGSLFAHRPRVVIEVMGGIEPARTIVADALHRGIAVVTANKSLMAAHGPELLALAERCGVQLRYEASVVAGVPFLGTFARRPVASNISSITGIVNGTSNFILSKMEAEWQECADALVEAQRLGLAEPDPQNDLQGIDAAEKLTVLIGHFAQIDVRTADIETVGLDGIRSADLEQAREFGGAIKPVVYADWSNGGLEAFVGPAFVPLRHKLANIDGVQNAVLLHGGTAGELFYSGPGAGPAVTAVTILDDVIECRDQISMFACRPTASRAACSSPSTGWFVRVSGKPSLPNAAKISQFLGSCGVEVRRVSAGHRQCGRETGFLLTRACARDRIERGLLTLADRVGCDPFHVRAL